MGFYKPVPVLFILCVTALSTCRSALAEPKVHDGWRIKQNCVYQGELQITMCDYGLKVYNPRTDFTSLYIAPFTEVVHYDVHNKMMCRVPAAKNDNPYIKSVALFDGLILSDTPFEKSVPVQVCALPALRYTTSEKYAVDQTKLVAARTIRDNEVKVGTYEVLTSIKVDPRELRFFARFYGLPYRNAMPALFKYTNVAGILHIHLTTSSCLHAKIRESEFEIPPNLKVVRTSNEVLTGGNADMFGL